MGDKFIHIDVAKVEGEAKDYADAAETTRSVTIHKADGIQTNLTSIAKYQDTVTLHEEIKNSFADLSVNDAKNLLAIRNEFLNLDKRISLEIK